MVYIDESCYPANYDWLTPEQQENILRAVKERRETATYLWFDYQDHRGAENSEEYRQAWLSAARAADEIDDFLVKALNIFVEHNWYGHRGRYFLATYDDAVAENDYYNDLAQDAEGDVDEHIAGSDGNNIDD